MQQSSHTHTPPPLSLHPSIHRSIHPPSLAPSPLVLYLCFSFFLSFFLSFVLALFLVFFVFFFISFFLSFFLYLFIPECVAKGSRLTLGGLGVEPCSRSVVSTSATVRNRPQPFATVRGRALRRCHWGKLLQVTVHGCVTCQFAPLVICMKKTCRASNVMRLAAQAQRLVRSADCCAVPLGLAFGESCFWGVGCGRAIGICVSGSGIEALFS